MPRETLRALDSDVERLMLAGATSAAGDDELAARRAALLGFAAKAPALAKVAEQVGRVTDAKGRAVTNELLNLCGVITQLRGAQAAAGSAAGELRDVPRVPAIDTPLSYHQIEPLLRALTETGGERVEVITDAVDRGLVRDLRLVDAWLGALGDGNVGALVGEKAVPVLGEVAVDRLVGAFKLDGGATDARRLECLVAIQGAGARGLVERALDKGSPKVRAAAIEALGTLDLAAAEPIALRFAASDRSSEVRARAVATVLWKCRSDAALDALLKALTDEDTVRSAASGALGASAHPDAGARLLALLTPEVLAVRDYVPPKPKRGVKLTPAQQKAAEKEQQAEYRKVEERVGFIGAVVQALAARNEPAGVARVAELYRAHAMSRVRTEAGQTLAGIKPAPAVAIEAHVAVLEDPDSDVVSIAIEALAEHAPAVAYEKLAPCLTEAELAKKNSRGLRVIEHLWYYRDEDSPTPLDPRWCDDAARLLGSKSSSARNYALGFLSQRKDPRAFEPAVKLLAEKDAWYQGLQALEVLGDKRATPAVLKLLEQKYAMTNVYYVQQALRALDDPSAAPRVAEVAAAERKKKKPNEYTARQWEELAQFLARDRTLG